MRNEPRAPRLKRRGQASAQAGQGLIYGLVIAGDLWVAAKVFGVEFMIPYQLLAVSAGIMGFLMLRRYDLLTPWMLGRRGSAGTRVLRSWMSLASVLLMIGYVARYLDYFLPEILLVWFVITPLTLLVVHKLSIAVAGRLLSQLIRRRTCIVVFVNAAVRSLASSLHNSPHYELVGFFEDHDMDRGAGPFEGVPYLGKAHRVAQYVRDHDIDVAFVGMADEGAYRALGLRDDLGDTSAAVYYVPDFLLKSLLDAQVRAVEGVTVLKVVNAPLYGVDGLLKRLFDVAFSLTVLALLSPLMIAVALIIRLTSPGSVISKQKQYGMNGQRFWAYRFRSMYANPNADDTRPSRLGSRVTPIGRFIRRTSIDELPQFINVIRGEMSVVGPRSQMVAHNEHYQKAVRRYMSGYNIKPGLTGWAQVNGIRGETAQLERMEDRIRHDIDYVRNWSPLLDLRIILMTLASVLRKRDPD